MSSRPPRFVEHVAAAMDTTVSIQIVESSPSPVSDATLRDRARSAFRWFEEVEAVCSRFDPDSELSLLSRSSQVRTAPTPVSPLLFELLQIALAVAAASQGAFDPTLGGTLLALGFDRHWRTGQRAEPAGPSREPAGDWRHLTLDAAGRTVTLTRPLMLDLGGIAKGFAIDLAARELADLADIAINAGGDVYARGRNPHGRPWRIGVRHPRRASHLAAEVEVSNAAVCTSGDDQRRRPDGSHHLLDPRTGRSALATACVTVMAPQAVIADALATAAFVLGPVDGLALLEREQVQGVCIDHGGDVSTTAYRGPGAWTLCPEDAPAGADPQASHVAR